MTLQLRMGGIDDMTCVAELVRRYHAFENVATGQIGPEETLEPLLGSGDAGRIWLVELDDCVIGYVALCFGYSIEFGGRDAFIDELYILDEHRGKGIGGAVLEHVRSIARDLGIKALHLEVARDNERARRLYRSTGFTSRDQYHLMTLVP